MTAIILGILANVFGATCIGLAGWTWRDGDDMGALGGAIFGAAVMVVGHALLLWGAAG